MKPEPENCFHLGWENFATQFLTPPSRPWPEFVSDLDTNLLSRRGRKALRPPLIDLIGRPSSPVSGMVKTDCPDSMCAAAGQSYLGMMAIREPISSLTGSSNFWEGTGSTDGTELTVRSMWRHTNMSITTPRMIGRTKAWKTGSKSTLETTWDAETHREHG